MVIVPYGNINKLCGGVALPDQSGSQREGRRQARRLLIPGRPVALSRTALIASA